MLQGFFNSSQFVCYPIEELHDLKVLLVFGEDDVDMDLHAVLDLYCSEV